jgi:hypothetical protein
MAAGSFYLHCQLRKYSQHGQRTAIKLKKAAVRKHWKRRGEKYKGGESSPSLPSLHDSQAKDGCSGMFFTLLIESGQQAWPPE